MLNISPLNLMLWQRWYLIYGWALPITITFWCVLEYKNDKLHSTNIIACLLGLRYSARAQEYPAEKDGFAVKQCSLYRRRACQQMVIMQWHNCYQRCVQSAFRKIEEAIASTPAVGFCVGIQEALPSGGEVLRTNLFFH